jgi:hypothetical protein
MPKKSFKCLPTVDALDDATISGSQHRAMDFLLASICAYSGSPVVGTVKLYDSSAPKLSCRR